MLNEQIPENRVYVYRIKDKIVSWWHRSQQTSIFMMVVDESGDIVSGWAYETPYKTVNFNGETYDVTKPKYWFGRKTMLVLKGFRIPPDFTKYNENFVNITSLARSSVEANVKMNNRNAFELTQGLKNGDIILYAVIGSALLSLLIVALLFDLLHMPAISDIKAHLDVIQNNTNRLR